MPIVRIDIQAGKSTAYKRDILRSVRTALSRALSLTDDRIIARVIETPAENIDAPEIRSDRLAVIEISMLPAASGTAKHSLYAEIVEELGERPGIHQHDITLVVHEPAAECFAHAGVMQCTVPGDTPLAEDEVDISLEQDDAAPVELEVLPDAAPDDELALEPAADTDDQPPLAAGA